jgi:hypothetical protein
VVRADKDHGWILSWFLALNEAVEPSVATTDWVEAVVADDMVAVLLATSGKSPDSAVALTVLEMLRP